METTSALLDFCAGNSPITGEFPAQRPVTRSFDVSLIGAWITGWGNIGQAGDLQRHVDHYDVNVVWYIRIDIMNQNLLSEQIMTQFIDAYMRPLCVKHWYTPCKLDLEIN